MQDDHTQARRIVSPEKDHEFETPRLVRELRPESSQAPPASETDTGFQRRWEKVQTAFVARAKRRH